MQFFPLSATPAEDLVLDRKVFFEAEGAIRTVPSRMMLTAPHGLVIADGGIVFRNQQRVVADGGKVWLLGEGEVPVPDRLMRPIENRVFHENAIVLGFHNRIHENIGHFIADQLPVLNWDQKLWDAGFRRIVVCLVRLEMLQDRIRELIATFSKLPFEVVFEPLAGRIRLKHAFIPQAVSRHPMGKSRALPDLIRRASLGAGSTAPTSRAIYVSRLDASDRRPFDEPDLARAFEDRGFRTIRASELNVEDAARVFGAADIVVGPLGAALGHMIYCRPGTRVLFFTPENANGGWFHTLGELFGLETLTYYTPTIETGPKIRFSLDFPVNRERLFAAVDTFSKGMG